MMLMLELGFRFFCCGLFAIGGGLATLPFLYNISKETGWYTFSDISNMIAVSESTPGPMGVNMATYVGFTTAGPVGAVIATLGLITPSIIVILIIAGFLKAFKTNKYVQNAFYGLRPASTGLIGGACVAVMLEVLTFVHISAGGIVNTFGLEGGQIFNLPAFALAAVLLVLTNWVKKVKEWHPIVFIGRSAVVGVIFHFGGV